MILIVLVVENTQHQMSDFILSLFLLQTKCEVLDILFILIGLVSLSASVGRCHNGLVNKSAVHVLHDRHLLVVQDWQDWPDKILNEIGYLLVEFRLWRRTWCKAIELRP